MAPTFLYCSNAGFEHLIHRLDAAAAGGDQYPVAFADWRKEPRAIQLRHQHQAEVRRGPFFKFLSDETKFWISHFGMLPDHCLGNQTGDRGRKTAIVRLRSFVSITQRLGCRLSPRLYSRFFSRNWIVAGHACREASRSAPPLCSCALRKPCPAPL